MAPRQSTAGAKKPAPSSATSGTVYQFKITLKDIRPPIWRRIQVLDTTTLGELHQIIQQVMGWYNCHLHQFEIGGVEYGEPEPEYDFIVQDESKVKLNQVVTHEKSKFLYTYDFGDGWDHEILLEKVLAKTTDTQLPLCLKGKRACPPEDCGGAWGYIEFLNAIQDDQHSEHESMVEWSGGEFDPEAFDLAEVNQALADLLDT